MIRKASVSYTHLDVYKRQGRFSRRRKVYQFVTDLPKLSGKCIVNGYGFGENALMHHRRSNLLTVSLNREVQ